MINPVSRISFSQVEADGSGLLIPALLHQITLVFHSIPRKTKHLVITPQSGLFLCEKLIAVVVLFLSLLSITGDEVFLKPTQLMAVVIAKTYQPEITTSVAQFSINKKDEQIESYTQRAHRRGRIARRRTS